VTEHRVILDPAASPCPSQRVMKARIDSFPDDLNRQTAQTYHM
jgi:hypothetical protein